jgi:peptidyl-prolyl cis-trans isomerase A (cyclophilin A)
MSLTLASLVFVLAQAAAAPEVTPTTEATPKPLPNGPVVVLETSMGRVKIGLHQDEAPISVKNFIQYLRAGHYDGTIFHRVIPKFMVQGGGFEPDMSERPTRPPIKNEAANGLHNVRGTLAMARTNDANSATSQFFVNLVDNLRLDYGIAGAGYCVFGEVIEGMDVVDRIAAVETTTKGMYQNVPVKPVVITRARELATAASAPKPEPKPIEKPKP